MNMKSLGQKASCAIYLAVALLVVCQQHALQRSHANERAADQEIVRLSLEMAAIKSQQSDAWWGLFP